MLTLIASAQEQQFITGKVLDIITKQPVEGVNILIKDAKAGASTDTAGNFALKTNLIKAELTVSHVSYQTNIVRFDFEKESQPFFIYLTPKSFELSEAVITAKRQFTFSIIDFEFINTNVIILANNNRYNTLVLFLLDESLDTIAIKSGLPGKIQAEFFKDCFDNCHLVFKDFAYQIYFNENGLHLIHPVETGHFYESIENCLDETDSHLVFKSPAQNKYQHAYFAINKESSKKFDFITDFEQDKLLALADELNFINRNPGAFKGASRVLAIAYAKQIAFKPSINYLFRIGNHFYYFNHGTSQIKIYSDDFQFQSAIDIEYHQRRNWESKIIIDKTSEKVYTLYSVKSKYEIDEINLEDGSTEVKQIIPLSYPEKLKINNGYIYFLYKDRGNIWAKKELFRLKL